MSPIQNLPPFDRHLLLAIHDAGATPGKPFATTVSALSDAAGARSIDRETLVSALRSLVTTGVSVEADGKSYVGSYLASAEVMEDGSIVVTVGAPRNLIEQR